MSDETNIDTNPPLVYQYYSPPVPPTIAPPVEGSTAVVVNVNGASGPAIIISGGLTGYAFSTSGSTIALTVANAATVRSSIGAAASGANADINTFSALTGNGGVSPWTGTPNGAAQSTYPTSVASVAYVQAEMQALMDKMQDVTEFMMFLVAALLAPGVVET